MCAAEQHSRVLAVLGRAKAAYGAKSQRTFLPTGASRRGLAAERSRPGGDELEIPGPRQKSFPGERSWPRARTTPVRRPLEAMGKSPSLYSRLQSLDFEQRNRNRI